MKNVLVLNMGLKSVRSIIFTEDGIKLASASRPLKTFLNGDYVTQSPTEWWNKSIEVIKESIESANCDIDFITVTASSACLICVDKFGNELDKAIMVSDKRAISESVTLENNELFLNVLEATGLGANPYLMIPKIMWVKNKQPDLFHRTYKFLSPNDFLISKLTGKYYTDYFNAQKYHFDCNKNSYPINLLKLLGIEINTLPEVVPPGTEIGSISKETSNIINIKSDIKVVISTYDAICSFFGSGPSDEGDAVDVSGTVTSFRVLTKKNIPIKTTKIFNQPFNDLGINIIGGSNNLGGGLIEWVKQCYYLNENYPYEIMEKEARESKIGANGLIFLPYLLGERAPIWDNNARGVFFGLERIHTRQDMTKAVFESTGFIIKDMIDSIEAEGVLVGDIRISGGLSRISLISQLKADITGRNIIVLEDYETTSIGALIFTLVGTGKYKNVHEALEKLIVVRMIIKPNLSNYEKYKKIHKLYKSTYSTLKDLFIQRNILVDEIYSLEKSIIENL